ncbi:hypothetical protein N7470_002700 [Penicillium chermesinum]|nr:hypothetical protein N7470_002700 [Penicillium chermesinum]
MAKESQVGGVKGRSGISRYPHLEEYAQDSDGLKEEMNERMSSRNTQPGWEDDHCQTERANGLENWKPRRETKEA